MQEKIKHVVFDADGLIALFDFSHKHHHRGKVMFNKIVESEIQCIYPATALCEAVTVLQKPLHLPKSALFLIELINEGSLPAKNVNEELLLKAIVQYAKFDIVKYPSDTLFDAIIAAIAIEQNAAIFGFDGIYRTLGLKLAEDVLFGSSYKAS